MDYDELPDLMEEARNLGVSYGRTRTGLPREIDLTIGLFGSRQRASSSLHSRIVPRTRQTERVRANIREQVRRSTRATTFDPDQPSTSSGIESISENSSNSRAIPSTSRGTASGTGVKRISKTKKPSTRKTRKKRTTKKNKSNNDDGDSVMHEVRIREINAEGVEEETVTYVKIKKPTTTRRKTKRTKRTRKVFSH